MWVACSHQGSYNLKLQTFSEQKLPERNESRLLLILLGLFVSLNINLYNIPPNLQLYCQNWVYKVLRVLSWDCNQEAHLWSLGYIPCHPVWMGAEGREEQFLWATPPREHVLNSGLQACDGQLLICQIGTAGLPSSSSTPCPYPVPIPRSQTSYFRYHPLGHRDW